jgi:hypothetical protein
MLTLDSLGANTASVAPRLRGVRAMAEQRSGGRVMAVVTGFVRADTAHGPATVRSSGVLVVAGGFGAVFDEQHLPRVGP